MVRKGSDSLCWSSALAATVASEVAILNARRSKGGSVDVPLVATAYVSDALAKHAAGK